MRLCAVQLRSIASDIKGNVASHLRFVDAAADQRADLVFFPELSLTGYEPTLARQLATQPDDSRWDIFQKFAETRRLVIGVGVPLAVASGIQIGMIFFQPGQPRRVYAKQMLHADECPYFVCGSEQVVIEAQRHRMAPAICYESLQPMHVEAAVKAGADIYLASVAKPAAGIAKANAHNPAIAKRHAIAVLMANGCGPCDNFVSVGQSAAWNPQGQCAARLDDQQEGLVVYDTHTQTGASLVTSSSTGRTTI